jgi:anhydro-N-acetylmuramic acid kinase
MSGTSLDGLDIAFVRFHFDVQWHFELINYETHSYNRSWQEKLKKAIDIKGLDLKKLDLEYGKWVGQKVKSFIDKFQIQPDLIVSHGHTIFHQPEIGLTMQIGDGYQIYKETEIKTVFDLRSMDLAFEGQGAPLVPVGDHLLFSEYDFCLNLGGFSNISFRSSGERLAFDVCPVNIVLNALSHRLGFDYDKKGDIARSGDLMPDLLNRLNSIEYYQHPPPKSLGIEWVDKFIFPLLKEGAPHDLLNTFCHHISHQIGEACHFEYSNFSQKKMLITGGGAKNDFLISLIQKNMRKKIQIEIPNEEIIDFKEAIIFAFLGLLKDLGQTNCLKSVTGASNNSSTGLVIQNPISN